MQQVRLVVVVVTHGTMLMQHVMRLGVVVKHRMAVVVVEAEMVSISGQARSLLISELL